MAALVTVVGTAKGSNWGALDSYHLCTEMDVQSQCTANNGIHVVWLESQLMTQLRTATLNTMEEDYEPISGISAEETTDSENTDVRVFDSNFGTSAYAGYTTCASDATYGGSGISQWCRPHILYYNLYFENTYFQDAPYRRWIACHEMGHTFGLWHATANNHSNPGNSCMKNVHYGPEDVSTHDGNHLEDEY
ncbi:hypothetical protein BH18CHL1_BH18CHL1_01980 [soil metagenome]